MDQMRIEQGVQEMSKCEMVSCFTRMCGLFAHAVNAITRNGLFCGEISVITSGQTGNPCG